MAIDIVRDFTLGELLKVVDEKRGISSYQELWELADQIEVLGRFLKQRIAKEFIPIKD